MNTLRKHALFLFIILCSMSVGLAAKEAKSSDLEIALDNKATLSTADQNNGSGGVWMNLTDLSAAGESLLIDQFDIGGFSGESGTDVEVEVWTRPGSYEEFESSADGWTLTQTRTVTRQGINGTVAMPLATPIVVPDGETVAVYLQTLGSGGIRYTGSNDGIVPQTSFSTADLELFSAHATTASAAFSGSVFTLGYSLEPFTTRWFPKAF